MKKATCFAYSAISGFAAFISFQDIDFILQWIGSASSALVGVVGVVKVFYDYYKNRQNPKL